MSGTRSKENDNNRVLVLTAAEIAQLLAGRELEVIDAVRRACEAHARSRFVPAFCRRSDGRRCHRAPSFPRSNRAGTTSSGAPYVWRSCPTAASVTWIPCFATTG